MRGEKHLAVIIAVIVIIAIIAAIFLLYYRPPAPAPTVKLRVIGPWAGKEAEYFKTVLEEYKKVNPNVEFEYIIMRAEDLAKVLPLNFEAKTTPADVIITPWGWFIAEMAAKGHVVELTGIISKGDYVAGILDPVTVDGKIYAGPFTMWLKPGFWYRKSFFNRHGLSEPRTWDEFKALLDRIKAISGIKNPIVTGDGVGWPVSDVTEHFIITFAGPQAQLDLIEGRVKFTDPQMRGAFENYLVPLIKDRYFSEPIEWTAAIELWWKGEYGLYFMGTWITGMVEDANDIAFFPLPGCKGVVGGTDYVFIPKYTPNKDIALEFVKWLITEGQVVHASTPAGKIPTWVKAAPEKLWAPMQDVFRKVKELGLSILPDLDDTVGGDWQILFWDQLKLLWVEPDKLDEILNTLTTQHPKIKGG
jgi:multiple sugar transport system substrate-binding protein